jgi:hypothetical protein
VTTKSLLAVLGPATVTKIISDRTGYDTLDYLTRRLLDPGKDEVLTMTDTTDADALFLAKPKTMAPRVSLTPPPENGSPDFRPLSDQTVSELKRLSFTVTASDPDGGPLTYEASGLPRHATFDPVEQRFTWRPRPGQDGTWAITFTATDARRATSTLVVRVRVRARKQTVLGVVPNIPSEV